jgi:hypothetical protein
MRKLAAQWTFCAIAALFFCIQSQTVRAQDAVPSTTTSSATTTGPTESTTTTSSAGVPAVSSQPSGAGVFSRSPVEIVATVSGGYDDNINTVTGGAQASAFTNGHLILSYDFGNPRLQLTLNAGAGGTYYYESRANQNYDIDLRGGLGITYKATSRLTLGSSIVISYLTEPSFDYAGGLNRRNGNYFYTTDKFFALYEWTRRFSTKTSYTLDALNYDNNSIGVFANRVQNTVGNEFQYQVVPTTKLVGEYRFQTINYFHEGEVVIPEMIVFNGMFVIIPAVRLHQDSTTQFVLAGLDHSFNPRLSGSVRGGAEFRSYDSDGDRTGPYFEGTLNYVVGKRTSVSWTNRYGIEEPDVPNAQSRTTFRTGVQVKYDLTSRISANLASYYEHSDYRGSISSSVPSMPFTEDSVDVGLTLRYAITPYLRVEAGYGHTEVNSDMALREYSRNRYHGGLSFTF